MLEIYESELLIPINGGVKVINENLVISKLIFSTIEHFYILMD